MKALNSYDTQNCLGCANLKINGIVMLPDTDGYDCVAAKKRVVDLFELRNNRFGEVLKKLHPPIGLPTFCPLPENSFHNDYENEAM